ncbi:uncharacterized protein ACIQIH_001517 isoform 1-T1 [Cyanocitta cristata]
MMQHFDFCHNFLSDADGLNLWQSALYQEVMPDISIQGQWSEVSGDQWTEPLVIAQVSIFGAVLSIHCGLCISGDPLTRWPDPDAGGQEGASLRRCRCPRGAKEQRRAGVVPATSGVG